MIKHTEFSASGHNNFSDAEYQEFRSFLQHSCGIDLGVGKEYLVATRIRRVLAQENISSLSDLLKLLRLPSHKSLRQEVVDVMTTNETLWFRDSYPFEYLKKTILPDWHSTHSGQRAFKVWSSACSTGQEPYSINMIIDEFNREFRGGGNIEVQITATDISSGVLLNAKAGLYDRLSIARGLSQQRLRAYFSQHGDNHWQIDPLLQKNIHFKALNLQNDNFGYDQYDIIYCRNVLIYFNADLKLRILRKIHSLLAPRAYLFLGASESVSGAQDLFDIVNCHPGIVYRKK